MLFVAPTPPRLDAMQGGARMVAQLIAAMAERHTVGLVYLRAREEADIGPLAARCTLAVRIRRPWTTSFVGRRGRELRLACGLLTGTPLWTSRWTVSGFAARLRDVVTEWAPDIVQFETHVMAQYAHALAGLRASRVLHEHEPGTAAAEAAVRNSTRGPRRWRAKADHAAWRRYERRVIDDVDRVVVLTSRDHTAVTQLGARTRVDCIPFGTDIPPVALNPAGTEPSVLFVGGFAHYPNVDAAERLLTGIFPSVVARHPAARLLLVGSDCPPHLRRFACPGATVVGPVPDVTPYLDRAALVAAPLRLGGGMRVKVLEALAAGKAVVCSRLAAEGLDVRDGVHVRFADDDAGFSAAILDLLGNDEARRRLGAAARAWASANATWERTVAAYGELYRSLAGSGSHPGSCAK